MDPIQNDDATQVPATDQPAEGMAPEAPVVPGEEAPVEAPAEAAPEAVPAPEGEATPEEPAAM